MVKSLLLVAILANIIYLVYAGRAQSFAQSSAVSSASSSGSASQSYASANAGASQYGRNQQAVACGSAAASANSTSNGNQPPPCDSHPVPLCRINEEWSNCPIAVCRPKTCDDVGFPVACPDLRPDGRCPVQPGCICQEGYVKNFADICIPMAHCPKCGGDPYAISGCGMNCNQLCSNYNKKPGVCALGCMYNSCDCRKGYVFDEIKKICVLPSDCTSKNCTKKHEVYDPCPAFCPKNTCGIDDAAISCVPSPLPGDPSCPPPVCRCENGYYRNDVGECVLWKHCPRCKGLNEEYDPCPAPCPPQRCDVNIALILCAVPPKLGDPECKPGCRCIEDHVRNKSEVCIPRDQCPTCPNKNEVYDPCIAPCPPRRCDVDERLIKCAAPPQVGDPSCVAGCRCDDGFYKNSKGVCVTKGECEPRCKGKHEIFSKCVQAGCRPKYCFQLGFPVACPKIDPKYCKQGCLCKDGYLMDDYGNCVSVDQCPSCGEDPNAGLGCGTNCGKKCEDVGKKPGACPDVCVVNGCDCKNGYYFDKNKGKCVLPSECTPICGNYEVFDSCINGGCSIRNCTQMGGPKVYVHPKKCRAGCACKEGYLRDADGDCIPIDKCPKLQCDENERYEKCPAALCAPLRCDQLGFPVNCTNIEKDTCPGPPGCVCKDDLVRDKNEKCIPKRNCPSCGGDPNAWSGCGVNCGKKCEDIGSKKRICPRICFNNACDCKDNFYLDSNSNKCVPADCCTPKCGENEVVDSCVNGGCGHKNCSQLNGPMLCIDPIKCKQGCTCKKGYLREDATGLCVPEEKCPNICNKPNEEYVKCPPKCPPQTCESINKTYHCPLIKTNETDCTGECRCINGFYRNLNGECISKSDCLKCPEDHEYFSCGPACDNVCCDLDDQTKDNCTEKNIKCVERCYCEDGYARIGDEKSECVPISDCPAPKCGENEVVDSCVNGGCGYKNCSQLNGPMLCIDPIKCKQGCTCKKGYLRVDATGLCVPEEKCPNICNKPNEEYVKCPPKCPPQTCESINKTYHCPLIKTNETDCTGECRCINGFYRNLNGECISKSDCLKCPKDHEYFSCGPACDNVCCDLDEQTKDNCIEKNIKCVERCYCEDEYARIGDEKSECVPISDCPG